MADTPDLGIVLWRFFLKTSGFFDNQKTIDFTGKNCVFAHNDSQLIKSGKVAQKVAQRIFALSWESSQADLTKKNGPESNSEPMEGVLKGLAETIETSVFV